MQTAIHKLLSGAKDGLIDTQVEFGVLLSVAPPSVKLDEDPAPLEANEMAILRSANLRIEDVGRKVAMLRCANGQYLLVGVVE